MTNGENCVMLYNLFKRLSKASQNVGNILQAQSLSDTHSWWGLLKYRAGLNSASCICICLLHVLWQNSHGMPHRKASWFYCEVIHNQISTEILTIVGEKQDAEEDIETSFYPPVL